MKKILFLLLVAFFVSGVSQAVAYDYTYGVSVNDTVYWDGMHAGSGGVFGFSNADGSYKWSTFCVEIGQHLVNSTTPMRVTAIADSNSSGTVTRLNNQVAWLYSSFSNNTLAGYDYTGGTTQADLQNAIWYSLGIIEDLDIYDGRWNNYTPTALVNTWLDLAKKATRGHDAWINNGLVQILQLGTYQDVLIMGTAGTNPVPEPTTMALLGIGLIGLVAVGRKKATQN